MPYRRVSVIILREDQVLLVKLKDIDRALPRSTWVFPFLDLGEGDSPRKLMGDLLTSLNISFEIEDKVFKYVPSENPKLNYIVYVVSYKNGEPDVSRYFQTYKWVNIKDITAYSTSFMDANVVSYLNSIADKGSESRINKTW
ncbi:MAG: hypothetical protein OH316_00930 [Candidatus Parvarchaeota archaeon]|nr:hypothetical protein [Candidatus Parvarchaeota archaeon]MCW1301685.1 hypothetical protein [Candidatus Parvarchaeota archaeon]